MTRVDGHFVTFLWVWVLREIARREGEIELTQLLREIFQRDKHHTATHVTDAMLRRGYVSARREGSMIHVRATELGRRWLEEVEPLMDLRNAQPPEHFSDWKRRKTRRRMESGRSEE